METPSLGNTSRPWSTRIRGSRRSWRNSRKKVEELEDQKRDQNCRVPSGQSSSPNPQRPPDPINENISIESGRFTASSMEISPIPTHSSIEISKTEVSSPSITSDSLKLPDETAYKSLHLAHPQEIDTKSQEEIEDNSILDHWTCSNARIKLVFHDDSMSLNHDLSTAGVTSEHEKKFCEWLRVRYECQCGTRKPQNSSYCHTHSSFSPVFICG
uniref:ARP6 protein n=1 Tax=Fopius arisanus TaxID=64838 RepID=A0A0C9PIC5_9HYME